MARIVNFENRATDIAFENLDEIENPFGLDLEKALITVEVSKKENPKSYQSPIKPSLQLLRRENLQLLRRLQRLRYRILMMMMMMMMKSMS